VNAKTFLAFAALPAFLAGCPKANDTRGENKEPLTLAEAQQALEETSMSGEATSLVAGTVEITTDFTIGGAVEQAAEEIASFVESQLPCAGIELIDNTLTVEYGANPGNCTYNGQTYSGTHAITVELNDEHDVLVHHEWTELSNQKLSVSGFADVTWSLTDATRHVVHELTWTRLSDGRTGTGSGDRLQGALHGNILEGFTEDGNRTWEGEAGTWDLDINGIEWRWIDPVPQAGDFDLETPKGKHLTMSFSRIDDDTIQVTVAGPEHSFDIHVNKWGGQEVEDSPES
jgi:hypothetical protein